MKTMTMTKDEQIEKLARLESLAIQKLAESQKLFTSAILAIDRIRNEMLFIAAGYNSFEEYLKNFCEQNGISRSLLFENLAVVRLARRAGFTDDEIEEYDIRTIKPFFEKPVIKYDRNGGIKEVAGEIANHLDPQKPLELAFGEYVKNSVSPKEPPTIIRESLRVITEKNKITYTPFFDGVRWGLRWKENGTDGVIFFASDSVFPEPIEDIARKLNR